MEKSSIFAARLNYNKQRKTNQQQVIKSEAVLRITKNKNKLSNRELFNNNIRSLDKSNHCEVAVMIQTNAFILIYELRTMNYELSSVDL